MALFVNMHHAACIALNVDWYGEWVPSKANVGDIMTRPERYHELLEGLARLPRDMCKEIYDFDIRLPPLGGSVSSLKSWMRAMRTKCMSASSKRMSCVACSFSALLRVRVRVGVS